MQQWSCPEIEDIISKQTCSLNVSPTAISLTLQKIYGSDLIYAILANTLFACLSKKIFLEYNEKFGTCSIKGIVTNIQTCSPQSVWELNVILSDIIEYDQVVKHGSILVINHAQRFVEYFEPNGSVSWTLPCGTILQEWAMRQYPTYSFISPNDFCPIGLQQVTKQDTCWLWSLFYFYLRVKCPSTNPQTIINNLLNRGPLEISNLLIKFACFIKTFAGEHKIGTVYSFYKEAKDQIVKIAINAGDKHYAHYLDSFIRTIDTMYLSGEVNTLVTTILAYKELVKKMDPALVERVRNMTFID